jgi:ATP-dependent DNA helicase RecQ
MNDTLMTTLRAHFGFASFRPGQGEAIESLLAGQHTLTVMPTGAGKSLIYQLAALHNSGLTLVISPLIALMKDQVDGLTHRRIPATFINSTLTTNEQNHRLHDMVRGVYKLIYIAPERLRSASFLQALQRINLGLLAIDEAHCLSQWGHDFRPDYLHLAKARHRLNDPLTVALTATATPQVQDDIVKLLELPSAHRVVTGFNRPNLSFEVLYTVDPAAKKKVLQKLLADLQGGRAIIYVGTRRDAEEVVEFLQKTAKLAAQFYHAGLPTPLRTQIQNAFMAGNLPIVAATNAFGMGIDRPDVRLVAHYSLPGTLEAYYQEAGRAGRDGEASKAVLLYTPEDRALQEWFIENDTPTAWEVRTLYDAIRGIGKGEVQMSPGDLCQRTGFHEVKVRLGLAHLEVAGIIERLGDEATRMLLRAGKWDENSVRTIAAGVEVRRRHRWKQLAKMIAYAETNACRRRILLDHFGDGGSAEAPRCCDNCLAQQRAPAPSQRGDFAKLSPSEQAALIILDAVRRLKWNVGREKLAQMLKGSKAKEMQQFGYDKTPYYGRLAQLTIETILDGIEQLCSQGYFKIIGGSRPILRLTPKGEAAIKTRITIALSVPGQSDEHETSKPSISKPEKMSAGPQIQRIVQLGEIRSSEGAAELIAALQNSDGNVRRLAASALGKIGDRCATAPLLALLEKETKPQVRQYAVKALGRIRDQRARTVLEKIAADKTERRYVSRTAQWALNRLSNRESATTLPRTNATPQERLQCIKQLGELRSPDNVPALIEALKDSDVNIRCLAVIALGKSGARHAVEPIMALLQNEAISQIREFAVSALGLIRDARARPLLEKIAADKTEFDHLQKLARNALERLS